MYNAFVLLLLYIFPVSSMIAMKGSNPMGQTLVWISRTWELTHPMVMDLIPVHLSWPIPLLMMTQTSICIHSGRNWEPS